MEPKRPADPPQMAREEDALRRLATPIAMLVVAFLAAMAVSERFASIVAPRLHLATTADVRAAREESRAARYQAAGVLGFEQALADLHARQADVETQMSQLASDYDKRFHGPFPQDQLADLDKQIQDIQGRLARLEERVARSGVK